MNRFRWCLRRLRRMSVQEIAYRTFKAVHANGMRFIKKSIALEEMLDGSRTRTNFYFDTAESPTIRREFEKLFPGKTKSIITQADAICNHRFRVFDFVWDEGRTINWHKDAITGKTWPLRYWTDIDYRHDKDNKEVRFIWELNRFQHLTTLGKAYLLSGEKRYASEIKSQLLSWLEQNPPYAGINWANALEVSLRLISWSWAYRTTASSGIFSIGEKERILKSIYLQTMFIKGNLSKYSSANNHLIGEACALVILGLSFPEFKDSGGWLNKGVEILSREMLKQTYPDGVTKEQAFGYQAFVMELFLLSEALMNKNGIKMPQAALDRFFLMAEFIMNVMDRKGNVPNVGDSDGARAIRLSEGEGFNIFKSLLTSAAILSGRADFKKSGGAFSEEHFWLFGAEAFKGYRQIKNGRVRLDSRLYGKGGYAVFRKASVREKESIFIMDCGELGYGPLAAHGHSDLMSITLSVDGTPLIIDPGTYLYHSGNSWRDYFRGTSAHNTVVINGKNQSEIEGPFMWGRRPSPVIEEWMTSRAKDYISVYYNNCAARHRRSVDFNKEKEIWFVRDHIEAKGKNIIRQYLHLAPGSAVGNIGENLLEVRNKGIYLYIQMDMSLDVSVIEDWSSSVFGQKVKSQTVVGKADIMESCGFDTVLYVSRKKRQGYEIKNS